MNNHMNNWDVSYVMIKFFEDVLKTHSRVSRFVREQDIFFRIERVGDLSGVNLLIVDRYTLGLADYHRAKAEFPSLTCLVTAGEWNGYTEEAKELATLEHIGLFEPKEFFGALWMKFPYKYVKKDREGNATYRFK